MKNKIIYILLSCLVFSLIFAGCGSAADKADQDNIMDEETALKEEKKDDVSQSDDAESEDALEINDAITDEVAPETEMAEEDEISEQCVPIQDIVTAPFYGIWVGASPERSDMLQVLSDLSDNGYEGNIMVTSDWENLNSSPIYVVTTGIYKTMEDAEQWLSEVQQIYPEAYIKYTGNYRGENTGRYNITVSTITDIQMKENASVMHAYLYDYGEETTVVMDENTVFAEDCDMQYFVRYKPGMSVMEWIKIAYEISSDEDGVDDQAILGVYDVSITDDHVDEIHGIYWWD